MEITNLGIRANRQQFVLLVLTTAFIGGMVGMERSLLPQLAENVFGLASKTAILSFIVAFGTTKAITNYYTGYLANRFGRKRLLVWGWLLALPIPWILMYAPTWNWIIGANILLGVSQGMAWSSTVVMKLDLVKEKDRGLAMGLNEFAGYFAIGLTAYLVASIAAAYGLRPYPFFVGVAFSALGLLTSLFLIKDTTTHMTAAASSAGNEGELKNVFWGTSLFHRNLSAVTQSGLVNNMNDGMMWGLYPLLLTDKGFSLSQVGLLTAIYPACWGIGQLFTGRLGDFVPKKHLLTGGMLLQGLTLLLVAIASSYSFFLLLSVVLGIGKALVYPSFAAAIAENIHPRQRAQSIGTFRFWRDSGYAIGAVLSGVLADAFSIRTAIVILGLITLLSSAVLKFRYTLPRRVTTLN